MAENQKNEGLGAFERVHEKIAQQTANTKTGNFAFTGKFGDGPGEWPIEPNRYRLIWMPGCPFAHKVVITRKLLGLDQVISLGTTGIMRTERGWVFSEDPDEVDPVFQVHYLEDIYLRTNPDYIGRPTVPIIADTVTGKAVTNDQHWIPNEFYTSWKQYHKENAPELYPEELREEIDELNLFILNRVNGGPYKCGFAKTQEELDQSYKEFFEALDVLEDRLKNRRFLFGDYITDSDIRLYPTLVRFRQVYYHTFRANRNRLDDFKNLWPYARDLYQTEGFRDTTYLDTIKKHYQLSPHLRGLWGNVHGLYVKGPDNEDWENPHDRERLSGKAEKFLFR